MLQPPCRDCSERYFSCHSSCEKYRVFRAFMDETAEKKRAFHARETDYYGVIHKNRPKVRR